MKKISTILLVAALACLVLVGCGNMSLGLGEYTFEHVHFSDEIESHCATVDKWYDNSNGIEVNTDEYGSIYLSEGTYSLFENGDKCPFCDDAE